ncbi:delta-like protein 4 isoform X1 [Osmerus eperlanus]|uniref:delta-like protein 4 isoform X1 n=1 Tax=Osmerus eperlanus TaxID=29151 RepID=UPI002E10932E
MALWFSIIVAIIIAISTQVRGSGVFELDLHQFQNSRGLLANGIACSPACRTFFRVCLKNYQNVVSPGDCIFGQAITPVLGTNSFGVMRDGLSEPIRLALNFAWPGAFSLIIEAWHSPSDDQPEDTTNSDLLINYFAMQRKLGVGQDWSQGVQSGKQTELRYSYRFICKENYYGDSCSKICVPRDDRFGHYTCNTEGQISCLQGWRGEYCEEPVCLEGCSTKNGNCSQPGECNCREGWQGTFCDECKRHPSCKHGTCVQPWQCACKEGWGGLLCDQDLNYCTHHKPCANGATCMNTGQGSYSCTCRPAFTGVNCDTEVRECDSKPCHNGGRCLDVENGYRCVCSQGFEGRQCETRVLTCADSPCFHNGECRERNSGRSYLCDCPRGFTGLNCEKKVDKCTSLPCTNGGRCVISGNIRQCSCISGFTGPRCEININECAGNPCANGATCVDRINDHTCVCPVGYAGRDCSRVSDRCASAPCLNGGTCSGGARGQPAACVCPPRYSGSQCQYYKVPLVITPSPSPDTGPRQQLRWDTVCLGVGLVVVLLVMLGMVLVGLRHVQQQKKKERDAKTMNNLSDFQNEVLLPTLQVKNTNKEVDLEVECPPEKFNHKHVNYHLDYTTSKVYKDDNFSAEKDENCEKAREEKMSLGRIYNERLQCRISTICPLRDSMYQSVFVIAEEKNECVIATEV